MERSKLRAIESSGGKLRVFEVYGRYFKKGESSGGFLKFPLKTQ